MFLLNVMPVSCSSSCDSECFLYVKKSKNPVDSCHIMKWSISIFFQPNLYVCYITRETVLLRSTRRNFGCCFNNLTEKSIFMVCVPLVTSNMQRIFKNTYLDIRHICAFGVLGSCS